MENITLRNSSTVFEEEFQQQTLHELILEKLVLAENQKFSWIV